MEIRLATQHDAEACNDFYNRIYHQRRTLTQWQWEFLPRDFPTDSLPYVIIKDQDRIVGTQAFIPIRMIGEQGLFWTVKSEETLLDQSYRGQRLFEKMYEVLFGFLKRYGIHCIWGFTPATRAFERLGFKIPQMTSQIFFPFTGLSVTAVLEKHTAVAQQGFFGRTKALGYRGVGSLASVYSSVRHRLRSHVITDEHPGLEIRRLDSAPPQAGELSERFIRLYGGITIYRDAAYLQWRLFDNPYVKTQIIGAFKQNQFVGWLAYSIGDDGMGYIIDIMVAPLEDLNRIASHIIARLILEAVDEIRWAGALGLRGWHVNEHPFDLMILKEAKYLGFHHIKRGHTVVLYTNPESDRRETIASFDKWFVTRIFTEGRLG